MKKIYLPAAGALLTGLFIYLFYRTEHTVINELVIKLFSENTFLNIRHEMREVLPLNNFAVYSLPEGLWVFSITLTSKSYYLGSGKWKLDGVVIPLIVSIGIEFIQLLHLSHGQFDLMDILASLLGWTCAMLILPGIQPLNNILRPVSPKSIICLVNYALVYLSYVMK